MSELLGYLSSFFVSFGLGIGFLIGGFIFAFFVGYGITLFFKQSRRFMREDEKRAFISARHRLLPIRHSQKRPN